MKGDLSSRNGGVGIRVTSEADEEEEGRKVAGPDHRVLLGHRKTPRFRA